MARVEIPVMDALGEGVVLPLVMGDPTNGHSLDINVPTVLLQAFNTDPGSERSITFLMTKVMDGVDFPNIVRTVPPMGLVIFGPLDPTYYADPEGIAAFDVDETSWALSAIRV